LLEEEARIPGCVMVVLVTAIQWMAGSCPSTARLVSAVANWLSGGASRLSPSPIPAVRAAALFVPDHLPATYVCAYYSLLNFVRAQAKC
jgi:hypothetical protein